MTTATRQKIGELLSEIGSPRAFSAKRTSTTDDLHLTVKGVGPLEFPVSGEQAKELCQIARPARYGQGERTLLDRRVRDTWQIPKSRVKIDLRRWKRTLLPMLEQLGADLGVPAGDRLKAEMHAMLVYAPGQFFLPHQDSEKDDEMVGTLVVTLPSTFKGGTLVVEHQGESASYRGSKKQLSFVAFYADCRHELRPVKEGYRIVLTYNLMLDTREVTSHPRNLEAELAIDAVAEGLREHFETPLPPGWQRLSDTALRDPPKRLVYLLDHQYTERGLSWQRLKGNDAVRAAALRAAAERKDCELMLALAEVHETWSCMEPGWRGGGYGGYRKHRSWQRDEEGDDWREDDPPVDGPDAYELEDLIDSGVMLMRWIDASGTKAAPIVTHVDEEELCSTTPSSALEPYASEYEGYMGNYGNTMERWYRRSAIVLWPRQLAFAVRAEASPDWALKTLRQHLRSGQVSEAQAMATSLLPFWATVAPREEKRGFFAQALRVAEGLEASTLATSLLRPFRMASLTSGMAPALVALMRRYGEGWAQSLITEWSSQRPYEKDPLTWIESLPGLCKALCKADGSLGNRFSNLILPNRWTALKETIEEKLRFDMPSLRDKALTKLARPILGMIDSAELIESETLRAEAVTFFCADRNELLIPALVRVLRTDRKRTALGNRTSPSLETIRRHCISKLTARLEQPAREAGDWSIDLPMDCPCDLCATLGAFLSDPQQQQLDWPIAKAKRMHVHRRIDAHELPVRHTTHRSGSPYTLILRKSQALFEREAKTLRSWQTDLDWLTGTSTP